MATPREKDNAETIQRLWVYGLLRSLGAPPRDVPRITVASLGSGDELHEYTKLLAATASSKKTGLDLYKTGGHPGTAVAMAVTQKALTEVANSAAGAIPIVSIIFTAADLIVKLILGVAARRRPIGCDTVCKGNKDHDRRALLGIRPPPGRRKFRLGLPVRMGDGIIWEGLHASCSAQPRGTLFGEVAEEDRKVFLGAFGGVTPADYKWEDRKWKRRTSQEKRRADLMQCERLPRSVTLGNKKRPWESPGNNYCYREWVSGRLFGWLPEAVSCSALICMKSALGVPYSHYWLGERTVCTGTKREGKIDVPTGCTTTFPSPCKGAHTNKFGQSWKVWHGQLWSRQVGSMWYAGMWFMHADFSAMVHYLKASKASERLRRAGLFDAARLVVSNEWDKSKSPFEYFQASRSLSLKDLQKALTYLAEALPEGMSLSMTEQGRLAAQRTYKAPNPFALARVQIQRRVAEFKWTNAHSAGAAAVGGLGLLALYTYFRKR